MKKIILIISLIMQIITQAQNFTHPLNSSLTLFSSRNITVGGDNMVPVAIATSRPIGSAFNEKVAISWYVPTFVYGHATKVRVYNTMADFESNAAGTDISGLVGVEALAYDNAVPSNLYVMETENAGGNMKIYNSALTLVTSYSSGDIGTALGSGFSNARGMAFDPTGNVFIADDANNRIVKIAGSLNKATATITSFVTLPAGSSPKSVAIKDNMLYVACFSTKKIRIYNLSTAAFVTEISTGNFSPLDLDIRKPNGNHVYSSQLHIGSSAKVAAYDISNNAEVQTYTDFGTSAGPWGLNVNSKGNLYCSDGSNNRFVKYARTLESGKDMLTFTVDNQIGASVFDNTTKTINITVPAGYNMASVNTHYTISDFASATPESYDFNLFPTNFSPSNMVDYTVTAENGSTQVWKVKLNTASSGPVVSTYPYPFLAGYWQSWDQATAPFMQLSAVNAKYNVINVSFALASDLKGQMVFNPSSSSYNAVTFKNDITALQAQGRKVLISVGGSIAAGGLVTLPTVADRDNFITSMNGIMNTYGFDGIDIDMEEQCFIFNTAGTLSVTQSPTIDNLIFALKSIMTTYRTNKGKKMLLSMAPETSHVCGSLGAYSYLNQVYCDGYLPIIEQMKDSIDAVFPQLYGINVIGPTVNDRTGNFGKDGNLYYTNTPDNFLAVIEDVVLGFQTKTWNANYTPLGTRGLYNGLPAKKFGVGLASCDAASNYGYPGNPNIGSSFMDSATVASVVRYLRGTGAKPGSYTKLSPTPLNVGGLMTWSINYDATTCYMTNGITKLYSNLFDTAVVIKSSDKEILTYSIPSQVGTSTINSVNATIAITMPAGTNISALTPTFTLSSLAISSPASGLPANYSAPLLHTVTAENLTTKAWTVTVTVLPTLSSDKDIVSYSIPNQVGTSIINPTAASIDIAMPVGTDLTSLVPSFTISPNATSNIVTATAQNFSAPLVQTITAQDGSTKAWTIKVTSQTASILSSGKNSIQIYPNPISTYLNLSSTQLIENIEVTTLTGNKILEIKSIHKNQIELNCNDWNTGIYFIKISDAKGNSTIQKLTK